MFRAHAATLGKNFSSAKSRFAKDLRNGGITEDEFFFNSGLQRVANADKFPGVASHVAAASVNGNQVGKGNQ
jgi:hypothetical protein